MDLEGKVALVTGGARRVGRAIALALAARGMDVLVHYHRSEAEAQETVEQIRALGVRAEAAQANLGNPLDIEHMVVVLENYFGRVDVLVNNASTFQARDALEMTIDEWNYVMAVNLRAPFLCCQRAAHLMLARASQGVVVNIADVAGLVPWPRFPHHSVSKAGLIMLTEVLAKTLGPEIRVNAVVPGPVLTLAGIGRSPAATAHRGTGERRAGGDRAGRERLHHRRSAQGGRRRLAGGFGGRGVEPPFAPGT